MSSDQDFQLTVFLQQFDDAWQNQRQDRVEAMLANPDLGRDDLVEMVMIDLEYRWRRPGTPVLMLEEYVRRHPLLGPLEQLPLPLIAEEYRVRHRWGDEPSTREYRQRFGDRPGLGEALQQSLQDLPSVVVNVTGPQGEPFQTPFLRSLVIGRQHVDQPGPICVVGSNPSRKLIIAPLHRTSVSRNQLQVTFDGKDRLSIVNTSTEVPVLHQPGGVLDAGKSVSQQLPLSIWVDNIELRFTLSSKNQGIRVC